METRRRLVTARGKRCDVSTPRRLSRVGLPLVCLCVLGSATQICAQDKPSGTIQVLNIEVPPASVEKLVATSDLIVYGRLVRRGAELNSNGVVVTHYEVLPIRILSGQVQSLVNRPGVVPGLVVAFTGGTVRQNGSERTTIVDDVPLPKNGVEAVLFLRHPEGGADYRVVSAQYGVFSVVDGRLEPNEQAVVHRVYRGQPLDVLLRAIETAKGKR